MESGRLSERVEIGEEKGGPSELRREAMVKNICFGGQKTDRQRKAEEGERPKLSLHGTANPKGFTL